MGKSLKKRIYTSSILFFLLFLMYLNNYILGYLIIIFGTYAILEFLRINQIINKKGNIKRFFTNVLFVTYIFLFCMIFFIYSNYLHLKIIIFTILLMCTLSDVGGYIFGKLFGGPKLIKISPNKTISGALGSLIFTSLVALLFFYYLTNNLNLKILLVGVLTSVGCQLGDLFFSYLKRKSSLNDTGNILPGHGGILDRVDGILLGIPVGLISLLIFYWKWKKKYQF